MILASYLGTEVGCRQYQFSLVQLIRQHDHSKFAVQEHLLLWHRCPFHHFDASSILEDDVPFLLALECNVDHEYAEKDVSVRCRSLFLVWSWNTLA